MGDQDADQDQDQCSDRDAKNSWLQSGFGMAASLFQSQSSSSSDSATPPQSDASADSGDGSQGGMSSQTNDGAPYSSAGTVPSSDGSSQGDPSSSSPAASDDQNASGVSGPEIGPPPPPPVTPVPSPPPSSAQQDPAQSSAQAPSATGPSNDTNEAWQEGDSVGLSGGMPMCRDGVSQAYQDSYDAGYEAGKAKRNAVPDDQGARQTRPDEGQKRMIAVLDDDGLGYHMKEFAGDTAYLDMVEEQERLKIAQAMAKGLASGAAGARDPGKSKFPGDTRFPSSPEDSNANAGRPDPISP